MNEITNVRMNNWLQTINECKSSGLTVKQWCSENGVSKDQYYYWLRKIRLSAIEESGQPEKICFTRLPDDTADTVSGSSARIRRGSITVDISNEASDRILGFIREVIISC